MEAELSEVWTSRSLGRRRLLRSSAIGIAGMGAAALIGCGSGKKKDEPVAASKGAAPAASSAPAVKKRGGVLKTSLVADPPGWSLFQASGTTAAVTSHGYDKLTDVATGPGKDG